MGLDPVALGTNGLQVGLVVGPSVKEGLDVVHLKSIVELVLAQPALPPLCPRDPEPVGLRKLVPFGPEHG